MRKFTVSLVLLAVALMVAGCAPSDRPKDLPKLTPCMLTIVDANKAPVEGAMVQIVSEQEPAARWTAGGLTDANGKIDLMVQGKFPGVVPGTYKVLVTKLEVVKVREEQNKETGEMMTIQKNVPLLAPEFGLQDKTPLTLTVLAGQKTEETLSVTLLKK